MCQRIFEAVRLFSASTEPILKILLSIESHVISVIGCNILIQKMKILLRGSGICKESRRKNGQTKMFLASAVTTVRAILLSSRKNKQ